MAVEVERDAQWAASRALANGHRRGRLTCRIGRVMRLACIVVLIGCASPRPVERGTTPLVSPRPELAVSNKSDARLEQPLATRERSESNCRRDSDCNEHRFGVCGYLSDGFDHSQDGAMPAVLHYRGRACIYAQCASTACREKALPTPTKDLAHERSE